MILCCGEALIDMLPRKLQGGEEAFMPVAGGAIFNTAITIGRLGGEAGFFCGLSDDMMGDVLRQSLEQSHVDYALCPVSSRPTTLALVKLADGQAKYVFYDEGSAGRMLSDEDLPELKEDVDALHFGAISLIPEPSGSAYETFALREAGKRVISLDPNIRPGFIQDREAHKTRIFNMIGAANILKLSDEDFDWLVERDDQQNKINEWLNAATSIVIITRGAEGAEFHTRNGSAHFAADRAEVVDTVGAGDSFNGGFLLALKRAGFLSLDALRNITPAELESCAKFAMKVAAITVSRAGANPPWEHEMR